MSLLILFAFIITLSHAEYAWSNWTMPEPDTFEVPEIEKMYYNSLPVQGRMIRPVKALITVHGDLDIYSENVNFHMNGSPGMPGVTKMTVSWKDFYAAFMDLHEEVAQLKQRVKELEKE